MNENKIILLTSIIIFTGIILSGIVEATYYVKDPVDCPVTYSGQSCSPVEICGITGGIAQCYDTPSIFTPVTYEPEYQSQVSSGLDPGYVMDCHSYDGISPYCDTWKCSVNSTCQNTYKRVTQCASTTATSCGLCRSGYYDCNGDGLECEIQNGATCYVGSLQGTYSGCSGSVGNCVITKSYFETGTLAEYSSTDPMLWWKQYNPLGWLMKATNYNNESIGITNESCLSLKDNTTICGASDLGSGGSTGLHNMSIPMYANKVPSTLDYGFSVRNTDQYWIHDYYDDEGYVWFYLPMRDDIESVYVHMMYNVSSFILDNTTDEEIYYLLNISIYRNYISESWDEVYRKDITFTHNSSYGYVTSYYRNESYAPIKLDINASAINFTTGADYRIKIYKSGAIFDPLYKIFPDKYDVKVDGMAIEW